MSQALYRKYRSRSLDDVVGQEHITGTLQKALEAGRISHAYLFTGPRGVGKTSVARILAHQINGLPYEDDSTHIDVIEIDAASNRRIDEIRELRDKVYVAPASSKYKVYIIDEVHMLTREAFNALLKTLEEPPAHVVFVLATTDAHKLPDTIVSRTQRFSFRPAAEADLIGLLRKIAKAERFETDDEALSLIAKHGGGSYRDSVSLLDQASGQGDKIDVAAIERLLGLPPAEAIDDLLNLVSAGSSAADLMQALTAMYDRGNQAVVISQQLGRRLRQSLAAGSAALEPEKALNLLAQLVEVPASYDPEKALEIALLKSNPDLFTASAAPKPKPAVAVAEAVEPEVAKQPAKPDLKAESSKPKPVQPVAARPLTADVWPEVLQALKQRYNTLYGIIRMAQPDFADGKLTLAFAFNFHQKRLNENSNRQKLVDTIFDLTGQTIDVECIVDKAAQPPKITIEAEKPAPTQAKLEPSSGDLSAISNIFGDAELLES